jgi:hypothetical protein
MTGSVAGGAVARRLVFSAWAAGRRREVGRAGAQTATIEAVARRLAIAPGVTAPLARKSAQRRRRFASSRRNTRAILAPALGCKLLDKVEVGTREKPGPGIVRASLPNGRLSLSSNRVEIFATVDQNSAAVIEAGHRSRRTTCRLAMTSSLRRRQVSLERRGFFQVSTEARLWPRPGAIRRDGLSGPFRRSAL